MCLSCELVHTQLIGLETFWNASLRVEIKVKKDIYLIGLFSSPRTADAIFFDSPDKDIEKALVAIHLYKYSGRYERKFT